MLIHVKIEPEAKKDEIIMKNETSYIVSVKEKAENNAANAKMLSLVATYFKVKRHSVHILTGHHARGKIVEIEK